MRNEIPFDLDAALDRQKEAWLSGSRPDIRVLASNSNASSEHVLDLIYNEVLLREEIGEHPALDEYLDRFPHLDDDLRAQFEVHEAVRNGLNATLRSDDVTPNDEPTLAARDDLTLPAAYEVQGELGRGGMGIVYKARDRKLRRIVALKMFHPGRQPTPRELSRFRGEAQAIARLQHANIVQIFEVGDAGGLPYLVLEFASGGTLQHKLQTASFDPLDAAELIRSLAAGVQHAHEHHVVHRDLKPANVLFTAEGVAKVTDFGLAKLLQHEDDQPNEATRSGEPIGTPRYMSPEQAGGQADRIGPAADVYALGTLLYECLTGRPPFVSPSVIETVDRIRHELPIAPRRLQRSVPRGLETICLHCLHKEPHKRYASAQGLADDLTRFLEGKPIIAKPTPLWERGWMWSRRNPGFATALAMAGMFLIATWVFFAIRDRAEQHRIGQLRIEIAALVQEGQQALAAGDGRGAKERFQEALAKTQSVPVLNDHLLGVRGWLDHCQRAADRQLGKLRKMPPFFDERRDEAILLSFLADPAQPDSTRRAHDAIDGALEFALPNDPAWQADRETLIVADAKLLQREGKDREAFARLEADAAASSAVSLRLKASLAEQFGTAEAAIRFREKADASAPQPMLDALLHGIEHARGNNLKAAIDAFDEVLGIDPEHFVARCLQAICFLRADRHGEAKVALTACIAQRPRHARCHALRGQAHVMAGNLLTAATDLQRAHELGSAFESDRSLQVFAEALQQRSEAERRKLLAESIETEEGRRAIGNAPFFQQRVRLEKR
jgi:serine/threonine protein kinase